MKSALILLTMIFRASAHLGGILGLSKKMSEEGFVGFDNWWNSNTEEIDEKVELKVEGSIPSWLSGALVRNGPGLFEMGGTKVNHQFDGLSKITKFAVRDGKASFQARFLRTALYNATMKQGRFPPHVTMVPVSPPLNLAERIQALANQDIADPANIFIWRTGNVHYATADSCPDIQFDLDTLSTVGKLRFKNNNKDTVTGAHKQPAFAKEDSGITVGWQGSIEMLSGKVKMNVYIDSPDMTRHFIGQVMADAPPIVHSFGVTENYVLLVVPCLEVDIKAAAGSIFQSGSNFSGLSSLAWRPDKKAAVHVFDMHSKDPKRAPVRTFELDTMYFNHHVNAWEKNGEIFMDLVGYADGSFITNPHGFANLDVEKDAATRRKIGATTAKPELRRYRLNMEIQQDKAYAAGFEHLILTDAANGFHYTIEMPRFNDRAHRGRSYCHVYAMASHIQYTDDTLPNLIKADLCKKGTSVEWYEENHYPSEPIFVPRPGAVDEDDGVVLAVTLDGPRALTYLLVLDGKTMRTLAKAYSPVFQPYDVHGQFFPDASMYQPVEVLV